MQKNCFGCFPLVYLNYLIRRYFNIFGKAMCDALKNDLKLSDWKLFKKKCLQFAMLKKVFYDQLLIRFEIIYAYF